MHKPDPENLINDRPSLVDLEGQGAVFVADARTRKNGWVRIKDWENTVIKVPPHRVRQIRRLKTERYGERRDDGSKSKRIKDEAWRARAARIGTSETDSDGEQPVVADEVR